MEPSQAKLCKDVEAEMINASALMEAEAMLDRESDDYFRGFLDGYAHCLKLSVNIDALHQEEKISRYRKLFANFFTSQLNNFNRLFFFHRKISEG